jgi:hypothetical protein
MEGRFWAAKLIKVIEREKKQREKGWTFTLI